MNQSQSTSPDKIIVDRRRKQSPANRMVRETRRTVLSGQGRPIEYEIERLQIYAQNHFNARITLPVFILIVAVVAAKWLDPVIAVYWALVTGISYALHVYHCQRFLHLSRDEIGIGTWRMRFLFGQGMISLSWIALAWYHCKTCGTADSFVIVQFSTLLVAQAVTTMLAFTIGAGQLLVSAPATIVLALRLVLTYDPASMVMGGILVSSQVFFYLIGNRFRGAAVSDIAFMSERENLIAELEMARSISDEARRRAEESNMAKSRFLATMSHELRTPLNAILGFSEIMKNEVFGPIGNSSYREYAGDIHSSGTHLLNVINEILDLSRIEAGRHELSEGAVQLQHVAEAVIQMMAVKAQQKKISVQLEQEEDLPPIWADERAVRQVTLNLLSNALKFTPPGGTILIRVGWTSGGGQYLSVRDNGPGIPEEEIPIVLSTFGQGSIAIKSAEQGSGLGLPIVQALMHMHGGRFDLKSRLREGTEVIASFPRSRVMETAPRPAGAPQAGAGRRAGSRAA